MPPKTTSPVCVDCKKTESLLWRTLEQGQICQECFELRERNENDAANKAAEAARDETKPKDGMDKESKELGTAGGASAGDEKKLRKSTRATRFKAKASHSAASTTATVSSATTTSSSGKTQSKGRNRRSLFKRTPFKTPLAQATTHVVNSVFYKGSYLQVGDIVSLVDNEDNVYYAQIRGLLVDSYCEKSAFLTWLIPTQASPDPKDGFDAATYLIGPDEELSRKLSCLEFVMHAPSNYYLDRTTPYPLPDIMEYDTKPGGYIWTTLPEYQRNKKNADSVAQT